MKFTKNGDNCEENNSTESEKNRDLMDNLVDKVNKIKLKSEGENIVGCKDSPRISKNMETMEEVAEYIKSEKCKRIIVLCGAGLSTPCGIPDFRSPKTGIFDNLKNYNLPFPEAIFHIDYFRKNPAPFYEFSVNILNNIIEAKPSLAHYFIKLLANKGLLVRVYTQNIDGLEELAGLDEKLICCAHGSFKRAHCVSCFHEANRDGVIKQIINKNIPKCVKCNDIVKPDIVFYGESLPKQFHDNLMEDINDIDLLIVMGTSLTVQPVSSVAELIPPRTPRLLINKTNVWKFCVKPTNQVDEYKNDEDLNSMSSSPDDYYMTRKMCYQDIFYMGTCDNGCKRLAELLGWEEELEDLYRQGDETKSV